MSSSPPRRFKPEPVETSTKSSRKFVPEPMETTTKSNQRFAPEPVETSFKSNRRFAPEPVETTTKSNNKRFAPEPIESSTKSNRRFAPEPVETSTKSSKSRFTPQPMETSTRSSRNATNGENSTVKKSRFKPEVVETSSKSHRKSEDDQTSDEKQGRRKFSPELIETAQRTRKSDDNSPALQQKDRTEATPVGPLPRIAPPVEVKTRPPPTPLLKKPDPNKDDGHDEFEARRLGIPFVKARTASHSSTRSHSFRLPDLETIESSESGESNSPPSMSTSPLDRSDLDYLYKHATRLRESVDDRYSGYLLQLAAKAAEKQLHEQALAAFPNDDRHEPVDHFIDRDSESDSTAKRRSSSGESSYTQINWELREMHKHQARLAHEREEEERLQKAKEILERHGQGIGSSKPHHSPRKDPEVDRMRTRARPPMLGGSISFPRCQSPDPARFDVSQGSAALKASMCYLTAHQQPVEHEREGLWEPPKKLEEERKKKEEEERRKREEEQARKSRQNTEKNSRHRPPMLWPGPLPPPSDEGGLWMGFCKGTESEKIPRGDAGLLTPAPVERENPFEAAMSATGNANIVPPSPPPSNPDMNSIDAKIKEEVVIESEFNDTFVTQLFNYLSLGYPSIAHDFDEELSKISRIPVKELRTDDKLVKGHGYIRLGNEEIAADAGISEEQSARWRALKEYVHEWARQQPRMLAVPPSHALGGFGVAARRGSWGV